MKAEHFATIVLPFEHLDFFLQIGQDISVQTPLYLISIGRKALSAGHYLCIQKVECSGPDLADLTLSTVEEKELIDTQHFLASPIPLSDIQAVHYDSQSHTLVVQTLGKASVYQLAGARLDCDHEIASIEIHSDEKYLGIKSGQVFI